jgi:hypothetical protein
MEEPPTEDTAPDGPAENEETSEVILSESRVGVKKVGHSVMAGAANIAKSAANAASKATQVASKATDALSKETMGMAKTLARVAKPGSGGKVKTQPPEPSPNLASSSVAIVSSESMSEFLPEVSIAEATTSMKKEADPSPPPTNVVKPMESSSPSELMMEDHMILWVVVASIGVMQILENLSRILANEFPFSFVLAAMVVGFTVGLEMDRNTIIHEVKINLLGLEDDTVQTATTSSTKLHNEVDNIMLSPPVHTDEEETLPKNPLSRFFKRRHESIRRKIHPVTALRRIPSAVKRDDATTNEKHNFDINLLRRLQRFRTRKSRSDEIEEEEEEEPALAPEGDDIAKEESHVMGAADINKAQADVLSKKLDVKPMAELRGMDVFLADIAEVEMSNHPFLLK